MADKILELRKELGPTGGWKKNSLSVDESGKRIRQLEKMVNTDPLTGLAGERALNDMVNGLESRFKADYAKGQYLKGTFVVMDMTGLHNVNDEYGKLAGGNDYVLSVSSILKEVSRENGRCFRNGEASDEFLLYLPGYKVREDIEAVLNRIDSKLEESEQKFQNKYPGIKFGLSYSVATFHRAYGPKAAFADANNTIGEAKKSKAGRRVGNIGRIFVNAFRQGDFQNE